MSARLDITRAQAKAIAAAAKAMGCVFEIERDGTIYRVIPEDVWPAKTKTDKLKSVDMPRGIDL